MAGWPAFGFDSTGILLITQPLIGIYSDHSHHRMGRRRPILMAAGSLVLVAIALIAYCEKLAGLVSDKSNYKSACIIIAVIAFYLLDFSINAFMASSRALIVDSAETSQQGDANAWAGRMLGVGNLFGYFVGNLNLVKIFPWIGDTQLRVLCIFAISFFILTTAITCFGTTEIPLSPEPEGALSQNHTFSERFAELLAKIRKLPVTVRQICFVQLFAWLGWFPFLFYASSWVSAIASKDLALDLGIRCGSFALLMFAIGIPTNSNISFIYIRVYPPIASFKIHTLVSPFKNMGILINTFRSFVVSSVYVSPGMVSNCDYRSNRRPMELIID